MSSFFYNLSQNVNQPTHVKGNILDLITSSSDINIVKLSIKPRSQFLHSDHYVTSFSLQCTLISHVKSKPGYVLIILELIWMEFVLI